MYRNIIQSTSPGTLSVEMFYRAKDDSYMVVYGNRKCEGLSSGTAVLMYRECVDHQMECAGILPAREA